MATTIIKQPVILYFINGPMPSEGDKKAAEKFDGKAKVVYRNAYHIQDTDALELADGVEGAVPPRYKEVFQSGDAAVKKYEEDRKKLSEKVGDEEAPLVKPVTNVDTSAESGVKTASTTDKKAASVWKAGK